MYVCVCVCVCVCVKCRCLSSFYFIFTTDMTSSDLRRSLGDWYASPGAIESLRSSFLTPDPHVFPHAVIDGFLDDAFAEACCRAFPRPDAQGWSVYCNPIEIKLTNNDIDSWPPPFGELMLSCLQHPDMVQTLRYITGIPNLENDPHMHGGGLHCHPRGGKLDLHLDYDLHPLSGKERRLNLILYLNRGWREEYGGDLQLWGENPAAALGRASDEDRSVKRIYPTFNRAVLFRTTDESWHGIPDPIRCPAHMSRNSVAVYYVSDPRDLEGEAAAHRRCKADFVGCRHVEHQRTRSAGTMDESRVNELRAVRQHRRLNDDDTGSWRPPWDAVLPPSMKSIGGDPPPQQ